MRLTLHKVAETGFINAPRAAPPWSALRCRRQQNYDTERTDPIVTKALVSSAMESHRRAGPLAAVELIPDLPTTHVNALGSHIALPLLVSLLFGCRRTRCASWPVCKVIWACAWY